MDVRATQASLSCSGFHSHQLCVSALSLSDHRERFRRERHTDTQERQREETVINLFHSSRWGDWANESPVRCSWTDIRGFLWQTAHQPRTNKDKRQSGASLRFRGFLLIAGQNAILSETEKGRRCFYGWSIVATVCETKHNYKDKSKQTFITRKNSFFPEWKQQF